MKNIIALMMLLIPICSFSQCYKVNKACLLIDEIDIDSCINKSDTLLVICFEFYQIQAKCQHLSKETSELNIITVLKRTEWPTIGYKHIMDSNEIGQVMSAIKSNYGTNESRITKRLFSKKPQKPKFLSNK